MIIIPFYYQNSLGTSDKEKDLILTGGGLGKLTSDPTLEPSFLLCFTDFCLRAPKTEVTGPLAALAGPPFCPLFLPIPVCAPVLVKSG